MNVIHLVSTAWKVSVFGVFWSECEKTRTKKTPNTAIFKQCSFHPNLFSVDHEKNLSKLLIKDFNGWWRVVVTKIVHFLKVIRAICALALCSNLLFYNFNFLFFFNFIRFSGVFMWCGKEFLISRFNARGFFLPNLNASVFEVSQVQFILRWTIH